MEEKDLDKLADALQACKLRCWPPRMIGGSRVQLVFPEESETLRFLRGVALAPPGRRGSQHSCWESELGTGDRKRVLHRTKETANA